MKSFALHTQQSIDIVFLTLFTHFRNSYHNPCNTPTTTYCTFPLQVVCSTSSTDSTSLTGSTARSAPHTLVALLLLSQPPAFLSTHLARSTWSQKEPEGARRSQKEPEGARRSQKEPEPYSLCNRCFHPRPSPSLIAGCSSRSLADTLN